MQRDKSFTEEDQIERKIHWEEQDISGINWHYDSPKLVLHLFDNR